MLRTPVPELAVILDSLCRAHSVASRKDGANESTRFFLKGRAAVDKKRRLRPSFAQGHIGGFAGHDIPRCDSARGSIGVTRER